MKKKIKQMVMPLILILLSFYGGWQIRELGISEDLPCALGRDKADDNMSDEKPTFNTIDSILLQAMSYCKANGSYPELNLIEIPIGATINRGRIADQYGRDIRYGVTSAVLEVRSAGKDGLFGTGDDIVGIIPSDKVGRRITSKNETFSYEVNM